MRQRGQRYPLHPVLEPDADEWLLAILTHDNEPQWFTRHDWELTAEEWWREESKRQGAQIRWHPVTEIDIVVELDAWLDRHATREDIIRASTVRRARDALVRLKEHVAALEHAVYVAACGRGAPHE